MAKVDFEIPRRAIPGYLKTALGDYYQPQQLDSIINDVAPGHRFLLYFHAIADMGAAEYERGDRQRKKMLQAAAAKGDGAVFERELEQGRATLREERAPLKNGKHLALQAVAGMGNAAEEVLEALHERQRNLLDDNCWRCEAVLTSPLLTGGGNPHPVENGFAFLSPYGVPYLAGSGIKGVLRRAAEELALLESDSRGWSLSKVWALFGFDENSTWFQGRKDQEENKNRPSREAGRWCDAYDSWLRQISRVPDPVLTALLPLLESSAGEKPTQDEFLRTLRDSRSKRSGFHFQGLLGFDDAIPQKGAQLGVDILNPHHRSYYQGEESPHDADQPRPVFFLVLEPGGKFLLSVRPLPGRTDLRRAVGDWKGLLDAAFDHAAHWLGFGAKTSVGYGALVQDREAEEKARRLAEEEAERRAKEEEAARRRAEQEAARKAQEEEERKRQMAEAAEAARRRAEYDALPESRKTILRLREFIEEYEGLSGMEQKKRRNELNELLNTTSHAAAAWTDDQDRKEAADLLAGVLDRTGWSDPGKKKKSQAKQKEKRREMIARIRGGE